MMSSLLWYNSLPTSHQILLSGPDLASKKVWWKINRMRSHAISIFSKPGKPRVWKCRYNPRQMLGKLREISKLSLTRQSASLVGESFDIAWELRACDKCIVQIDDFKRNIVLNNLLARTQGYPLYKCCTNCTHLKKCCVFKYYKKLLQKTDTFWVIGILSLKSAIFFPFYMNSTKTFKRPDFIPFNSNLKEIRFQKVGYDHLHSQATPKRICGAISDELGDR